MQVLVVAVEMLMIVISGLIVEAALQAGCSILISKNMQDGFIIDAMQMQNPFLT